MKMALYRIRHDVLHVYACDGREGERKPAITKSGYPRSRTYGSNGFGGEDEASRAEGGVVRGVGTWE